MLDIIKTNEKNILNKNISKSEVLVSNQIDINIPTIVVDFDMFNLMDIDDMREAKKIVNNIKDISNIYTTSKDNEPIADIRNYNKLFDWSVEDGSRFLSDLGDITAPDKKIQLCGIYRELCIVEVASLIKKSALDIEPIIIDNDDYSISAKYSVQQGDTLENRLAEHDLKPVYV